MITVLEPDQVFVFGSNTQGRHGKGAAKQALQFGAEYSKAYGRQGQTYAIVTKELRKTMPPITLEAIHTQLELLAEVAECNPQNEFLLTPVGTGLGGFTLRQLEDILPDFQDNVTLTWR